jgi:hypothetical protein
VLAALLASLSALCDVGIRDGCCLHGSVSHPAKFDIGKGPNFVRNRLSRWDTDFTRASVSELLPRTLVGGWGVNGSERLKNLRH